MHKIGIIGERDSVLGFMALGLSVREAETAEKAGAALHEMAKSGEYAIIYITEAYAEALEAEIAEREAAEAATRVAADIEAQIAEREANDRLATDIEAKIAERESIT